MKKSFKLIGIILCLIFLLTQTTVLTFAADDIIGVIVEFDADNYVVGDLVLAKVYLTGVADDVANGTMDISAFEIHLSYNKDELIPHMDSTKYADFGYGKFNDRFGIIKTDATMIEPTAISGISTGIFEKLDGIDITEDMLDESDRLFVMEMEFEVGKATDGEASINIAQNYETVVMKKIVTDNIAEKYEITDYVGDAINVETGISGIDGTYSDGEITANVKVGTTNDRVVLIAGLYEKDGKMPMAAIQVPTLTTLRDGLYTAEVSFDYVGNISNLEIRYFVWDSFLTIKSVTETYIGTVK